MELQGIEHISDCFKNVSPKDISFLNGKKTQLTYFKGEAIIKQGAFAPHVLFVNDGLVKIYLQAGRDKQVNIRLAKKGDYMAFSTVFGTNTYQYSAMALTDSTICMIEKEALKIVLMRNPDFAIQVTSKNYQNENRYVEIIKNLSYKQMRGKLASALLYLATVSFQKGNIFQLLTRQDIADFASITMESTVKFLKEFEREDILSLENKNIEVKNLELLTEISRRG